MEEYKRRYGPDESSPVYSKLLPNATEENDIETAQLNDNNNNVDNAVIKMRQNDYEIIDSDVIAERKVACAYSANSFSPQDRKFAIVLQRLKHVFASTGHVAVKDLSLALSFGECFGLLGPNGAGKSTTMTILSGALRASFGDQYVMGKKLSDDTSSIYEYVGVCPQFDVVWNDLTVAEHLEFQARQRGVPPHRLSSDVQQAAIAVGLDGDGFYTKAGELSGGMRRRLSIAMSIVGNPPVVFMDGKFIE